MKKLSLLILISLIVANVNAQMMPNMYEASLPQIVPPTPQSQIFEKYVTHPITECSGLPEINIPLYEIEMDGLRIPISLSYHASGIKYSFSGRYMGTNDQPSNLYDGDIGAGWSLTAGGYRIARTIYGKPDEQYPRYDEDEAQNYLYNPSLNRADRDAYLAGLYYPSGSEVSHVKNTIQPYKDSEYDIFTYMLPTSKGHFILDKNKNPVIIEPTLEKISVDPNLENLTIMDDKGFSYYMGKNPDNMLLAETRIIGEREEKVGWPLKRIVSPFNRAIDFKYESFSFDTEEYSGLPVYDAYSLNEFSIYIFYDIHEQNYPVSESNSSIDYSGLHNFWSYKELLISEILTENVNIKIKRQMSSIPKNLIKEIEIKDKANKLIKSIIFEYHIPTQIEWHCLLKTIRIKDKLNNDVQIYKFDYNVRWRITIIR